MLYHTHFIVEVLFFSIPVPRYDFRLVPEHYNIVFFVRDRAIVTHTAESRTVRHVCIAVVETCNATVMAIILVLYLAERCSFADAP